ncbi:MAG: glycosyltransferase [Desulfovibrio sp.]|nr:glycosyltransferase [Desulfovibrio sp.]MBI4959107.1 glycosyltransferase [Desulfovibrio sp.]
MPKATKSTVISPKVSIVMPSHNHGAYIGGTIAAIMAQTFADWELIVMDYASTDATWDILDSIDDPRVIAVRYPEPGMGKALNEGFRRTRGQYVCWHQTDNVPYPDWLETMVRELDDNPDVGFVYSDFENIDSMGRSHEILHYGPFDPDRLLSYCLVGPTFLYRREVYETVGDYLESHPRDDHDYWVRIWQHGFVMKNLPVNLGANRMHPNTRMCRMREEYDNSLYDIIGPNIHIAQKRGEEVFRVRDRSPDVLEAFGTGYARLRSRIRYFLGFFMHGRPGMKLAVLGLGPVEKVVLDILDELGALPGVLGEGRYFAIPFMDEERFGNWGGDYVLICGFDPDGAKQAALVGRGIPREKIVHVFLPECQVGEC